MSELEVMDHCRLLLRGVRVLHERGLELTRISPGVAPSGLFSLDCTGQPIRSDA